MAIAAIHRDIGVLLDIQWADQGMSSWYALPAHQPGGIACPWK
jgi:hypothetical protein